MALLKISVIAIIVTILSTYKSSSMAVEHESSTFEVLHSLSEVLYRGNGSWGDGYPYRMALRDSYWRADVYSEINEIAPAYKTRSLEVYAYLQSVQHEGGSGVFGFPADTENPEFGNKVKRILIECRECIHNGWVATLPGKHIAELYYDHGYALTSLAKGYIKTGNISYLDSIIKAADWALDKPLHNNINYLSALSKGLSYAYKATGNVRYLNRAIYLHKQGIFPNLSSENGAATDRHNQQLEYHGLIVSGILALKLVIPDKHEFTPQVDRFTNLTVSHLQHRDTHEDGSYGETWPGTNLLAWHELEKMRPLTIKESIAKERCESLIVGYGKTIVKENGFRLQKLLYSNFFIGLSEMK